MLYPSSTSSIPASDSTTQNLAHLINQNAEQENRRPKLVAISDQTEIQKLRESDMEISDADSETATIVVKKEDEPIIFKKKSINPLPSPEPTKFSGVVPKPLPGAESLVTGADRTEPERTNHPRLSDEQGNVHTSANHATRLLVPIDGNSQSAVNYRQPLLDRPPPALPPHQQWMPPPPPHLRPSPPLPPNPPPTQSMLLTAVNALRKSTGFLQTTSATNHRSRSRQPRTSCFSFTPPTPPPVPRSSAASRMNTVALRALRGSLTTSTGPTRISFTNTRTHQLTRTCGVMPHPHGSNAVASPSHLPRRRPSTPIPTREDYEIFDDDMYEGYNEGSD
jgi:hypothetical protein